MRERRRRAHDDERARLVHGDVHQWNAPQATDGFKLIDPDGVLAEPECDLGVIMREDPVELMAEGDPRRRARWLAQRTGLDATASWEWGVAGRLSTGLLATKIGLQPVGREMLDVASMPRSSTDLRPSILEWSDAIGESDAEGSSDLQKPLDQK